MLPGFYQDVYYDFTGIGSKAFCSQTNNISVTSVLSQAIEAQT